MQATERLARRFPDLTTTTTTLVVYTPDPANTWRCTPNSLRMSSETQSGGIESTPATGDVCENSLFIPWSEVVSKPLPEQEALWEQAVTQNRKLQADIKELRARIEHSEGQGQEVTVASVSAVTE